MTEDDFSGFSTDQIIKFGQRNQDFIDRVFVRNKNLTLEKFSLSPTVKKLVRAWGDKIKTYDDMDLSEDQYKALYAEDIVDLFWGYYEWKKRGE